MAHIWYRIHDIGPHEPIDISNYQYIGEIPYDTLEEVFRSMNHVTGKEIEHEFLMFRVRSMSVGDIAITEKGTFLCDWSGWTNLANDPKLKGFISTLAATIA